MRHGQNCFNDLQGPQTGFYWSPPPSPHTTSFHPPSVKTALFASSIFGTEFKLCCVSPGERFQLEYKKKFNSNIQSVQKNYETCIFQKNQMQLLYCDLIICICLLKRLSWIFQFWNRFIGLKLVIKNRLWIKAAKKVRNKSCRTDNSG